MQLSGSEKEDAKNEALKLSLRYGFVTPLTSMVVTKPQGEDADVLDKPKEGKLLYNIYMDANRELLLTGFNFFKFWSKVKIAVAEATYKLVSYLYYVTKKLQA